MANTCVREQAVVLATNEKLSCRWDQDDDRSSHLSTTGEIMNVALLSDWKARLRSPRILLRATASSTARVLLLVAVSAVVALLPVAVPFGDPYNVTLRGYLKNSPRPSG